MTARGAAAILESINKSQHRAVALPEFRPGDSIKVWAKIREGEKTRLQAFEGVCIGKKNRGLHSSFTVRKISHGEGVERTFPLYSPRLESIEVVRRGDVRRDAAPWSQRRYMVQARRGGTATEGARR